MAFRNRLWSTLRRTRASVGAVVRPWVRPRRFHAYCVGAPKTGTHSIAGLCSGYRSGHEPATQGLITSLLAAGGPLTGDVARRWLLRRDRRLWLEMESSHVLVFAVAELAAAFPEAPFVLTVRHPADWLRSLVEHLVQRPSTPLRRAYQDLRFGARTGHAAAEAPLAHAGLHTVDGYLRYWTWHNETVLRAVPAGQLLVLRTTELSLPATQERLAAHLSIPARTLVADRSHSFKMAGNGAPPLLDALDRDHLAARVAVHCEAVIERLGLTPLAPRQP